MPEMQNFDGSPLLVNTVINVQRGVKKLPDASMSIYASADVGKVLQQFEVVE